MSKSTIIRDLGRKGLSTRKVAEQAGVSYQFAYNVLRAADLLPMARDRAPASDTGPIGREALEAQWLLDRGFQRESGWTLGGFGVLTLDPKPQKGPGVYAFVIEGTVYYVGVATSCVVQRLGFYRRPGNSQRTNIRLQALLTEALGTRDAVDVLVARPGMSSWNGLPSNGCAGLELGLIQTYQLPWNQRG